MGAELAAEKVPVVLEVAAEIVLAPRAAEARATGHLAVGQVRRGIHPGADAGMRLRQKNNALCSVQSLLRC